LYIALRFVKSILLNKCAYIIKRATQKRTMLIRHWTQPSHANNRSSKANIGRFTGTITADQHGMSVKCDLH